MISLILANPAGNGPYLSQIELGCSDQSQWTEFVTGTDEGNIVTPPAMATLNTSVRTDCAFCFNPRREGSTSPLHHCVCKSSRN